MYASIAPVELTTQVRRQFEDAPDAPHTRPAKRQISVRRRMSLALHAIANRLEPAPAH